MLIIIYSAKIIEFSSSYYQHCFTNDMIINIYATLDFFSVDDDNLGLCTMNCKKKNIAVPLVASFSALVVIVLISLGLWVLRRQKGTSLGL